MKKKFVAIVIIMTMIFGAICVPSFGASKEYSKYIKVKRSVYQKYKKENVRLKKELRELKSILNEKPKTKIETEHRQTILSEREIDVIDYMKLVDSYEKGKWYCYYVCGDGDCYTVAIKNGHVQKFVQLN